MFLKNFYDFKSNLSTFFLLFILLSRSNSQPTRAFVPTTIKTYPVLESQDKFAATLVLRGLSGARTIKFDSAGDLLVIARDLNATFAVYEDPPNSGKYKATKIINAPTLGLNHGLAINGNYLYASSQDAVYRWPYTAKQRSLITTKEQIVISGITAGAGTSLGANQGHLTRTIVFSDQHLYVSIGSKENIDPDSSRSRVRRFPFAPVADESRRQLPMDFSTGEVWADGLRNAVALGFDYRGRLWEVDNGPDNLQRPDLGVDIYNDNPGEEVNLLDGPVGKKFGYPYCFSAGNLTAPFSVDPIRGTQFAWPGIGYNDTWCRDPDNNQPPLATIPAHSSPLQVVFFSDRSTGAVSGFGCDSGPGAFPCTYANDAFIALHGSWNSRIPKGYRVSHLQFSNVAPFLPNNGSNGLEDIVWQKDYINQCNTGTKAKSCFRPSGLAFDNAGTMWVASGVTGDLVRVFYLNNGIQVQGSMDSGDIAGVSTSFGFSRAKMFGFVESVLIVCIVVALF